MVDASGTIKAGYDYTPFGEWMREYGSWNARYQFTWQEKDEETGLYNNRARLYDPVLKRFLDTDPAGQGFTPYAYVGNNPVVYVDPDGEMAWFVAALIGAGTNIASNWDAITQNGFNWGKFAASAVVGAGSSALDFLGPLGWAGGGFLSGFGNTLIQDGDFGDAIKFGITGSVTGMVSGYAGRFVDQNLASPLINGLSIESPVVKGLVGGAVGGLVIGGTMGVVFGEGDLGDRFKDGAISGALLGGVTGTISAGLAAHEAGYDPLTGKFYNSDLNQQIKIPDNTTEISEAVSKRNQYRSEVDGDFNKALIRME